MSTREALRQFALFYRRSSRLVVLAVVIISAFAPVITAAPTAPASLAITNLTCSSQNINSGYAYFGGFYKASGRAQISGLSTGTTGLAETLVHFTGSVTWYDSAGGTAATSVIDSSSFSPASLDYPNKNQATFSTQKSYNYAVVVPSTSCLVTVSAIGPTNAVLASTASSFQAGSNNPTFQLLVELPLFNDTMLGAVARCPTYASPCQLPLDQFYNFVLGIALVLALVGAMVGYTSNSISGKKANLLIDSLIPVFFIIAFPYIYNQVATLINYVNMALIAGPGNDYSKFAANINVVWSNAAASTQGGFLQVLSNPLTAIAAWVVDLVVYIGTFVLGTIRIWLMAVMVVAFPIALALRGISFTKKLGQMVEDTLFGLILASILSSIILGLAAHLVQAGGPSGTILGGDNQWFSSIALLTAMMIPTILAPLTGTLFQTGMQAAMAAGTVAVLAGGGGATGMAGGIGTAINPATLGLASGMGPQAFQGMSLGGRLAASLQHGTLKGGLLTGTLHGLKNVGTGLAMGFSSGIGATQLSKSLGLIAPIARQKDIIMGHEFSLRQKAASGKEFYGRHPMSGGSPTSRGTD